MGGLYGYESGEKGTSGRKLTIGTWIQLGHPGIAEILANAGYEWIAADCEHTDIDIQAFSALARAMYGRGAVPLARVRENDTLAIRQVLDAGLWV
jgi:2-keto-3-deoxy-L-rhamnonate aldolase RhmA